MVLEAPRFQMVEEVFEKWGVFVRRIARSAVVCAERDLRVDRPGRGALEHPRFVAEHAAPRVTGRVCSLVIAEELVGGSGVARHRSLVAIGEEA